MYAACSLGVLIVWTINGIAVFNAEKISKLLYCDTFVIDDIQGLLNQETLSSAHLPQNALGSSNNKNSWIEARKLKRGIM